MLPKSIRILVKINGNALYACLLRILILVFHKLLEQKTHLH